MLNIKVSVWDTQVPLERREQSREEKIIEMLPTARAVMVKLGIANEKQAGGRGR